MTELRIVPYDPAWPVQFAAERDRIETALGPLALRIHHHGSTSVPGLAAKPVIDIQVSVAELEPLDRWRIALGALGYVHVAHPDDAVCPFFHKPRDWPHSHHVHLVRSGSDEERRTLAFRDYLRDHADVAGEYERIKRQLAAAVHDAALFGAQESYANAKTPFVVSVTERALSEGYPKVL